MQVEKTRNSVLIDFTGQDLAILADSLIDPLVWFEAVANEKLANCKGRLKDFWLKKFEKEKSVENIPTDEAALLNLIFGQIDYKNRIERDEEAKFKPS